MSKDLSGLIEIARAENEDVSILGEWYYNKSEIQKFWAPFNLHQLKYEAHPNIVDALFSEIGVPLGKLQTDVFKNTRQQDVTSV